MPTEASEAVAAMIAECSEARVVEWRRRRDANAKIRAERKAARDAGLRLRHAAKLARNAAG